MCQPCELVQAFEVTDVRIVTYNIRHALGADGQRGLDRIHAVIASTRPDVVCLQEVDRWAWRSWFRRQDRWLSRRLGMGSVFGPSDRVGIIGRTGNALLLNGEIESSAVVTLPRTQPGPPRSALSVEAVVRGTAVSIVVAHLSVTFAESTRQLDAVLGDVEATPRPLILAGDLNLARPDLLGRGFESAEVRATFPSVSPRVQIDHVAIRGGSVVSAGTRGGLASDHLCLYADVTLSHDAPLR